MGARRNLRAVVLTALELEYEAVRRQLNDVEPRPREGTQYEVGWFEHAGKRWEVLIGAIGAGNSGAAVEADRAVRFHQPEIAMFVGVAGGVKDVRIGDVVAADQAYGYHAGKSGRRFQPRPKVGKSGYRAVQVARAVGRTWNRGSESAVRCFVAPIASGEEVVAARASGTFKLIRGLYSDAVAVDMEGYGFLTAVSMHEGTQGLVVRGISDLVDGKAEADRTGSQERAAANASEFAVRVLAAFDPKSSPDRVLSSTPVRSGARSGNRSLPLGSVDRDDAPLQLFICSRMGRALRRDRALIADAVEAFGAGIAKPWLWERDGIAGPSDRQLCLGAASESDLVVLLLANDVSPLVRAEVRAAMDAGARCFLFAKGVRSPTPGCRRLVATLARKGVTPLRFRNSSELRTHLVRQLQKHLRGAVRARRLR